MNPLLKSNQISTDVLLYICLNVFVCKYAVAVALYNMFRGNL